MSGVAGGRWIRGAPPPITSRTRAWALGATAGSSGAEVSELRITKQPSIIYLPLVVMEQNKLVEKQAKAAGLPELKTAWITFNSGGAATDALLSGSVDLGTNRGLSFL